MGADNVAHQRPVQVGPLYNDVRLIEKGLPPDDCVIVDGTAGIRAGDRVVPRETALPKPPAPGSVRDR